LLSASLLVFDFFLKTSSLIKDSLRTSTNGPFPDKKTEYSSSFGFEFEVAILRPTKVFPAPGTPVTKHIDLRLLAFE